MGEALTPEDRKPMARTCTVCQHSLRDEIDSLIVSGCSFRDISGRYELSKSALGRHASSHVAEAIAKASDLAAVVTADQLVGELRRLREVTAAVLAEAREEGDHAAALGAIARLEKQAELCGRLAGELVDRRVIEQRTILLDARWVGLRSLVAAALAPYPDALAAVTRRLLEGPVAGA